MDLTELKENQKTKIIEIHGGVGLKKRLENLGIREGIEIVKISSQMLRGPVTIKIGNAKIAIGYGMAKKIIVEKLEDR